MDLHVENECNKELLITYGKVLNPREQIILPSNTSGSIVKKGKQTITLHCKDADACGSLMFFFWDGKTLRWKGYIPIGKKLITIKLDGDTNLLVIYDGVTVPNIENFKGRDTETINSSTWWCIFLLIVLFVIACAYLIYLLAL